MGGEITPFPNAEIDFEPEEFTYTIWRTGTAQKRTYQINKCFMGQPMDNFWVELKGSREVFCNCQGFARQRFPKIEHKHVKIAMDFAERGEPENAEYRIHGTGAKTEIEVVN